jgi:uncharacterized damage-inducible protein DinB
MNRSPSSRHFFCGNRCGFLQETAYAVTTIEDLPMKTKLAALVVFLAFVAPTFADDSGGLFGGYNGEWRHVTEQLIALAEATPADKFAWRPAPGVRSTSEVYMHLASANFYLLSFTGPKMPSDLDMKTAKNVTSKEDVIKWLKRSFAAVEQAHAATTPVDMQRKITLMGIDSTVAGVYLRILVHENEHMGQLVAYARMTGVKPPWSQ